MYTTIVTRNGQITIPKTLRQQLGICPGSQISFSVTDDQCIELKVIDAPEITETKGYGLLKSNRPSVPDDFDPASLLETRIGAE